MMMMNMMYGDHDALCGCMVMMMHKPTQSSNSIDTALVNKRPSPSNIERYFHRRFEILDCTVTQPPALP